MAGPINTQIFDSIQRTLGDVIPVVEGRYGDLLRRQVFKRSLRFTGGHPVFFGILGRLGIRMPTFGMRPKGGRALAGGKTVTLTHNTLQVVQVFKGIGPEYMDIAEAIIDQWGWDVGELSLQQYWRKLFNIGRFMGQGIRRIGPSRGGPPPLPKGGKPTTRSWRLVSSITGRTLNLPGLGVTSRGGRIATGATRGTDVRHNVVRFGDKIAANFGSRVPYAQVIERDRPFFFPAVRRMTPVLSKQLELALRLTAEEMLATLKTYKSTVFFDATKRRSTIVVQRARAIRAAKLRPERRALILRKVRSMAFTAAIRGRDINALLSGNIFERFVRKNLVAAAQQRSRLFIRGR